MAKLIKLNFSRPLKSYSVNLHNKIMEDTIIKILDGENNQTTINNNLGGITTKVKVGVKIHPISRAGIKEINKDGTKTKVRAGVQIKAEIIKVRVTIKIKDGVITKIKIGEVVRIKEQTRIKVGEIIKIKVGVITKIKEQIRIKVGEIIQIKEQTKTTKIKVGETIKTKDGGITKIQIGMLIKGRIITDGAISQETTRMDGVINLKITRVGPLEKVGDYFLKSLQLNYNC